MALIASPDEKHLPVGAAQVEAWRWLVSEGKLVPVLPAQPVLWP